MKKFLLPVFSSLALLGLALGQQQPPTGTPPGGAPGGQNRGAMRELMQKYQPWFELAQSLALMQEVDKEKGLAFTKAQAKIGLPILTDLGKRTALAPKDATKILDTLESKFVSAKQLVWMDKTRLAREEERRKRAEERRLQQGNGQTPNVGSLAQGAATGRPAGAAPGGGFFGGRPGGQNGQQDPRTRKLFEAMQNNKPFNPFKDGVQADDLKKFMQLMSKR
jgi:hypothetical protein